MSHAFTLLHEGHAHSLAAEVVGDQVRIKDEEIERTLGWHLDEQGMCRDDVCVPVHDRAALVHGDRLDLAALAALLGQPLALAVPERAAALGAPAGGPLAGTRAPDFELADLEGKLHKLSDHRGKKVLLVAYASW